LLLMLPVSEERAATENDDREEREEELRERSIARRRRAMMPSTDDFDAVRRVECRLLMIPGSLHTPSTLAPLTAAAGMPCPSAS
jgi:hypothetical protein